MVIVTAVLYRATFMNGTLLNIFGLKKVPLVLQNEISECGLACLAMVAGYHGHKVDIATLGARYATGSSVLTLKGLIGVADRLALSSRPLSVSLSALSKVELPAIIHWDFNHFVVLQGIRGKRYSLLDPATGERTVQREEFSEHFTGVVLELMPSPGFQRKEERTRLSLLDLCGKVPGITFNLLQVLMLSVVLQLLLLASPFYLQLAVDEALLRFDREFMLVLALGFAGLGLIQFLVQALRSYIILYFSSMLSYRVACNTFRHLMSLPLSFFERRHTGDIISRFKSTEPPIAMLSEGMVTALIDGAMTMSTLVMMFIYSPMLALIVTACCMSYLALRMIFYRPYYQAQQEVIQSLASENSVFIETLRGISSIKSLAGESQRQVLWQQRYADVVNARARSQRCNIWFESINGLISTIEHVLLVYLSIMMSMAGEFTVGMIFAFMAYKRHFTENAVGFIDKYLEYRLLDLHLSRVADITASGSEVRSVIVATAPGRPVADLTLHDVSFRYEESPAPLLDNLDICIKNGESIVITGASGSGKTTLLKIMTGLLSPDSGQIYLGSTSIFNYGLDRYRKQIGVVMQEDTLFQGSIAENIAQFSERLDMEKVRQAARLAIIDDVVQQMPMGYESQVGDLGAALSAGQKQRLILARAIYREPSLLFIDEGTAHLDALTEEKLYQSLASLKITRISIAHRPAGTEYADRVLKLENGQLKQGEAGSWAGTKF